MAGIFGHPVFPVKACAHVLRTSGLLPDLYEDYADLAGMGWRSAFFTDTSPLKRMQYLLRCMVCRSRDFRELVFVAAGDAAKKISGQNHEV